MFETALNTPMHIQMEPYIYDVHKKWCSVFEAYFWIIHQVKPNKHLINT